MLVNISAINAILLRKQPVAKERYSLRICNLICLTLLCYFKIVNARFFNLTFKGHS